MTRFIRSQKSQIPGESNSLDPSLMDYGYVFDVKKYSIHDGPGIRTTVFLKGCPLVCSWCHNPESQTHGSDVLIRSDRCVSCGHCVEICPEGAITMGSTGSITDPLICTRCGTCTDHCPAEARELIGKKMTVASVLEIIKRDRIFYDESGGGATFSGGEPLAQPGFLINLLKACGKEEIHRVVDTSGLVEKDLLARVAPETDLFLYDLKVMDPELHRSCTGVSNHNILNNLRWLTDQGHNVIIRIPIVPGINDNEANTDALADFLLSLSSVPKINLLPFHQLAKSKHAKFGIPYRIAPESVLLPKKLELIKNRLLKYGLEVSAGENRK